MRVFLKTILTSKAEIPLIVAQFLELEQLIDRILLIEPSFTHTGQPRDLIGVTDLIKLMPKISRKLDYVPIPMTNDVLRCVESDESACHFNERLTRGLFSNYIDLSTRDIVISTDADEVLYAEVVEQEIERITSNFLSWKATRLGLHQFVYRDDLLATDFKFGGPSIIGCGRYFLCRKPMQWRYDGTRLERFAGCHFSWCQPISALIRKVKTFAHAPSYLRSEMDPEKVIMDDIAQLQYSFRTPPLKLERLKDPTLYWPAGYSKARQIVENVGFDPNE